MYILYIDFFIITYCLSITLLYCYYAFILYSYNYNLWNYLYNCLLWCISKKCLTEKCIQVNSTCKWLVCVVHGYAFWCWGIFITEPVKLCIAVKEQTSRVILYIIIFHFMSQWWTIKKTSFSAGFFFNLSL